MKNIISISRTRSGLQHLMSGLLIKKAIRMALKAEKVDEPCIISVLLTDNDNIRAVNKEFRDVDSATDVLSFPMNILTPGSFDPTLCETDPDSGRILLGDIVISIPRCEEQGIEFGHGFNREIMYLTVHSVLHLLGYDHVDEGVMKKQMREREKLIMGDR